MGQTSAIEDRTGPGGQGWPAVAASPDADYRVLREGAGLVDCSDAGKIEVRGDDRSRFLHGMVTNDVLGMKSGEISHACITDPRGSIQADVHVYAEADRILLRTAPGFSGNVLEFLDRFLIADDVVLADHTDDIAEWEIHGPDAGRVVSTTLGIADQLPRGATIRTDWEGIDILVARRDALGEPGYSLWVQQACKADLRNALERSGAIPVGADACETRRVEAGLPRCGVDFDSTLAPKEAGLADTVSYTKGCFIGQEMLAKMHNLGKPRRFLVGLLVDGEVPEPGTPVCRDGAEVGVTRSATRSITLSRSISLATLRRGHEASGVECILASGARATVSELPFI